MERWRDDGEVSKAWDGCDQMRLVVTVIVTVTALMKSQEKKCQEKKCQEKKSQEMKSQIFD